ncbi:hypothetical protein NQ317_011612 [Molorchus minor]|uniref:C2H2-type domain-containing protein n=1 Tax=Molorchus minor TaxID=1323400 RepID=A0ABQ9J8V7_9CUCU|nr:hypothetical protein NQ317_011612 [Molorchus minor]
MCLESFDSWDTFNAHITSHVVDTGEYKCKWMKCDEDFQNLPLLTQHISYHGYMSKLKNIGQNIIDRNNLLKCTLTNNYVFPVSPAGYTCDWEYCGCNFLTVYDFFKHMDIHIKNNPRVSCKTRYRSQYKLAEHLRTHTKEKTMACPTCCTVFSCKTKLCDHRTNQLSKNLRSYQCSQCLKLFPSERLLRDHMRSHINHYKCNITHGEEKWIKCEHCKFVCYSKKGLESHYVRVHKKVQSWYECHCCKYKCKRGGLLTKHLMKKHNYHWPSGHTRFRYRKDQDNIYRLQTVRYESLEVTQEMIRNEQCQTGDQLQLEYDNEKQPNYILSVSEEGEQSMKTTVPKKKNILITIDDVDEHGNIVKSQVMESDEVTVLKSDKIVIAEHKLPDLSGVFEDKGVTKKEEIIEEKVGMKKVHGLPDLSGIVDGGVVTKEEIIEEKPIIKNVKMKARKIRKNKKVFATKTTDGGAAGGAPPEFSSNVIPWMHLQRTPTTICVFFKGLIHMSVFEHFFCRYTACDAVSVVSLDNVVVTELVLCPEFACGTFFVPPLQNSLLLPRLSWFPVSLSFSCLKPVCLKDG